MLLLAPADLGGVLTIRSPCILPVLPFGFARADKPLVRSGLPMLAGMALTFAAVATLAAVAGGWAVAANQYGRMAAIVLLALFGLTLLFPTLSDRLTRPLVTLGSRLSNTADLEARTGGSILPWFLLGIATGLTTLLLLAYALGAATSLAFALLIGGRVFSSCGRAVRSPIIRSKSPSSTLACRPMPSRSADNGAHP